MEYYFKALDEKEYGPLGQAQIRDWLEQGRMDGNSQVRSADSDDWSPLSGHPELSELLAPSRSTPPSPTPSPQADVQHYAPHRGALILTFGILGIACCFPLGIAAWIMGNNDMQQIEAGMMDPTGKSITNAGKICGIIGTVLAIIGCGAQLLIFALDFSQM
jgi:hypothetical protein